MVAVLPIVVVVVEIDLTSSCSQHGLADDLVLIGKDVLGMCPKQGDYSSKLGKQKEP